MRRRFRLTGSQGYRGTAATPAPLSRARTTIRNVYVYTLVRAFSVGFCQSGGESPRDPEGYRGYPGTPNGTHDGRTLPVPLLAPSAPPPNRAPRGVA